MKTLYLFCLFVIVLIFASCATKVPSASEDNRLKVEYGFEPSYVFFDTYDKVLSGKEATFFVRKSAEQMVCRLGVYNVTLMIDSVRRNVDCVCIYTTIILRHTMSGEQMILPTNVAMLGDDVWVNTKSKSEISGDSKVPLWNECWAIEHNHHKWMGAIEDDQFWVVTDRLECLGSNCLISLAVVCENHRNKTKWMSTIAFMMKDGKTSFNLYNK